MKKNELKAVALKYPENASLPFVSVKAKGELAKKLVEIAAKQKIPVVENIEAANILSVQEIGSAIPENTWEIVAKIFAAVVECDKKL